MEYNDLEIDPTIQKKIDEINSVLDEFEKSSGLPALESMKPPTVLNTNIEDLKKKTAEELIEYGWLINQYSLYIQRLINKNKAMERWAKCKLDELTAYYIPQIEGSFGWNERTLMARTTPEACRKLNKFLRIISMRIDRLYEVPANIKVMADTVKELRFLAFKREKNE